jgi:hypothetical protein
MEEDFFRWHCFDDELFKPMRDALGEAVDFFDLFPTQQYLAEAAVGAALNRLADVVERVVDVALVALRAGRDRGQAVAAVVVQGAAFQPARYAVGDP